MSLGHRQSVGRYDRQIVFKGLGPGGQRRLAAGRVLVVGLGGLGCAAAELLVRAGVGMLRLVDDDVVAVENLHRQLLYDESDAAARLPKAVAAARRLARINSRVVLEAVVARFGPASAEALAEGVNLILDGTDNFATRFVINDLAVKGSLPWVFAGAVGSEAQTMTIVPGRTPCLRCVFDSPPPPCTDPTCRSAGVIGPVVAAVASFQAAEALKVLAGRLEDVSPYLIKMDLWTNAFQRIEVAQARAGFDCPCCKHRDFEFLQPSGP